MNSQSPDVSASGQVPAPADPPRPALPPPPVDPSWPRASQWLASAAPVSASHSWGLALIDVPTHLGSISPTQANLTPAAVRAELARYSTFASTSGAQLLDLPLTDLGAVAEPDSSTGHSQVMELVRRWLRGGGRRLLVALGGDNSVTVPVALGAGADGLVTLDAHHDLRDGHSNGSPVRELVDAGAIPGNRVVQVGISDFANSQFYRQRADDLGITIISRREVEAVGIGPAMSRALAIAGSGPSGRVHVDLDVDVCDRAVAPGCPASTPGGISAFQLREAARMAGADPRVVSLDIVEVDAAADTPDRRTVRLAALCVLEAAAGFLAGAP